jgi:hypothetical protein
MGALGKGSGMTPTALPASERAREAAAKLLEEYDDKPRYATMVRAGYRDENYVVRVFAAFERRILADQASVGDVDASGLGVREAAQHALDVLMEQTPSAYLGGPAVTDKVTARQQAIAKLRAALSPAPSAQGAPLTPTERYDER